MIQHAAILACAQTIFLASSVQGAPGTPSSDELAQIYNAASAAFAAGNYAAAAAGLERIVAQAPPEAQLESVYYTLGASYFDLGQYAKAIDALQTYRTKFPAGVRVAEASFSLGQAAFLTHDYLRAAEAFKSLEGTASYRSQALLSEGTALKAAGETDGAVGALEKLVGTKVHDNASANGALILAGLYDQKKQPDKAVALLNQIRRQIGLLDDAAQFTPVATGLGDALLEQKLPQEALVCYRAIPSRDQVIKIQTERVGGLQDELNRQVALLRSDPKNVAHYLAGEARLKSTLADAIQALAECQKLPDYEPGVLVRIATCFAQMDRKWETVVAYEELLRRYPKDATTEAALYGLIVASAEVGRYGRAHQLCAEYLKDFPDGLNANSVGYLTGSMALQTNDPKAAETYFGQTLATQPQSTYRETMRFLLGNAQFVQSEYDKASATYAQYLEEYPKGQNAEEATYRSALCLVFSGAYEKAIDKLDAYINTYPKGEFVPDARYRLAVCQFAASQNDVVIAACQDWEKQYGHAPLLGEVLALQADALAAKGNDQAAVDVYLRAYHVAATPDVVDYTITSAQKLLQKAGDWPRIAGIFERFLQDHPNQPSAVMAVYWIGKARVHEGKPEEAKRFVADTIKKYLTDPDREAVEPLLTQLATLCIRKETLDPGSSPSSIDAGKAIDPGAEMDELLAGAEINAAPLARARVLYAKSELARLRRQPSAQEADLEAIATGFKPVELDAALLAITGDHLLTKGRYDLAKACFERMLAAYPKSNDIDFAYNGLGEIAYQAKDYPKALSLFTDAVDKAGATTKLKDVTIGEAKTLLAMGRLDEATKLFEQIASTREWRGESTAFAVYSLGDIMRQQNKLPEAIAYYQRVYVAYQRYLPWVAKSYVASAECFERLGKNQEAVNTYRELLKNPKLQDFSEAQAARTFLQKNGQG